MWRHGLVPPSGPRRRGHDQRHAQAAQQTVHLQESNANGLQVQRALMSTLILHVLKLIGLMVMALMLSNKHT
jgi:uncharacterized membrane protein YqjE